MQSFKNWHPRREATVPREYLNTHGPLLGAFLWSRQIDLKDSAKFLNFKLDQLRSPFLVKNLEATAERLADAVQAQEVVAVYGDYDIDGSSGLTLLSSFLKACALKKVLCYQPDRFKEGYGVHAHAIENLAKQGATVVITVDTGITATKAANKAQELGIDLIITDHHLPQDKTPNTAYLVNPNQRGDNSGLGHLCGTGVAFYLCLGLRAVLRKRNHFTQNLLEPDLKDWLDLFCIATIADCVPLIQENRILTRIGLGLLSATKRPGLKTLVERCLTRNTEGVAPSARDISFQLAPKLNAPSRMGEQIVTQQLLLTESEAEAQVLVEKVLELNSKRSALQKEISQAALEQAQNKVDSKNPAVLVLHGEWYEGVLGIVAAKVMEHFSRPCIVLTTVDDGTLRGSMRSNHAALHSVDLLNSCTDLLIRFGGHAQAAGLHLQAGHLEALESRIHEVATAFKLSRRDLELNATPVFFDAKLEGPTQVQDCLALEQSAPWGIGNESPLFLIEKIPLAKMQRLKDLHAKWTLPLGPVLGFFKVAELDGLLHKGMTHVDALVTPQVNRFRGSSSVQFLIEHVRSSENQNTDS